MEDLALPFVFLQGVISFLSPCFLPLLPAYLSYLTGQSILSDTDVKINKKLIFNSLSFVLGFTLVFVLLGMTATALGSLLVQNISFIRKIGGIFIIIFGLYNMGVIKIPLLLQEKRISYMPKKPAIISSFLLGISFSFGWSACIGPYLAPILALSAYSETLYYGMLLLFVYSMGLGLPFLLIAVTFSYIWTYIKRIYKYMGVIKIISGALLVIMGIIIFMEKSYLLINIF